MRRIGLLCLACPIWFAALYAFFSTVNPGIDHLREPISRLGAVGEPGALAWNLLCFVGLGAIVVALGWTIGRLIPTAPIAKLAGNALIISGLLLVGTGVFSTGVVGDTTLFNRIHEMSGWGSFAAFLVAGTLTPWVVWNTTRNKTLTLVPLVLVTGAFASYALFLPELWGLRQRVGVMCYFLWVGVMGLVILRLGGTTGDRTPAEFAEP